MVPTLLVAPYLPFRFTAMLMIAAFVAAGVVWCIRPLRRRREFGAVLFCIGAALFFFRYHEQHTFAPVEQAIGQRVAVRAQVCDLPETYARSTCYRLEVLEGGLPVGTEVLFYDTYLKLELSPGDVVEGTFKVAPVAEYADARSYLYAKADGCTVRLNPHGDLTVSAPPTGSVKLWIMNVRLRIRKALAQVYTDDVAGLLSAISFGDRQSLPDAVREDYKAVGLSHMLAVSGLHLSVVTEMLYRLFRRLRLRKRLASAISIVFVMLFMALTGFSASVMRAGLMTILVLCARLVFREADGLNSIGFAVLTMVLIEPYAVWDIGLQLSVSATLGLLVILPSWQMSWDATFEERFGHIADRWLVQLYRRTVKSLLVSASAMVVTLVPVLWHYRGLSLLTPLANLLILPLANLLVPIGLVWGLLVTVCPLPEWLTTVIGVPIGLLVKLQNGIVSLLAKLPLTNLTVDGWWPLVWAAGVLLVILLSRRCLWRRRTVIGGCAACLLVGLLVGRVVAPTRQTIALAVDRDVAVYLEYQGKSGAVVSLNGDEAVYELKQALSRRGVDRLEFLWLTDLDGAGIRAIDVLLHDVTVEQILVDPAGDYLPELTDRVDADRLVYRTDDPTTVWDVGMVFDVGEWTFVEWGTTRLLITGDQNASVSHLPAHLRSADTVVCAAMPPEDWRELATDEWVVGTRWNTDGVLVRTTAYGTDCIL